MIGLALDAWQTPPAIERKLPDGPREWGGEQGETESSSTLIIYGKTGTSGEMATETPAVKAAEKTARRNEQHTEAFSEYIYNRKTSELVSLLSALKPNLQKPDGAAIMNSFRSSLAEIWHVAGPLPKEKLVVVSIVEEAVRNRKWRELSITQVDVLQRVLSKASGSTELSKSDLDKIFGAIHGSEIDIYPSAAEDFDDDETEREHDDE
jgi:hypothetical protein